MRGKTAICWIGTRAHSLIILLCIAAAFIFGYGLRSRGTAETPSVTTPATSNDVVTQWYTCSMHPEVRMPHPDDKCPICHMALIPVNSSTHVGGPASRQLQLSEEAQALLDVQTVPVVRRFISHQVRMVGEVDYDETRLAYITPYVDGRLDRLFVDYTGIEVRKGDHIAEIYSPELLVSLTEVRSARQSVDRLEEEAPPAVRQSAESMLYAARQRLRHFGLTEKQIDAAANGQFEGDHITLYAPIGGVVIAKNAKQGSYVKEGQQIYSIADLSHVWVILEAYESDLPWLRYGQHVQFTTQTYSDEAFEGEIAFIDPMLDQQKRTVRIRVNVDNADGRLRPGMFVRGTVTTEIASGGRVIAPNLAGKWISPMHPEIVRDQPGDCPVCGMPLVRAEDLGYVPVNEADVQAPLVVPDSAVLRTGRRGVVYLKTTAEGQTAFEGRQVELGPRGDGFFIVKSGLKEGDMVVMRGNFQIDSALQIQAKPSMMNPSAETSNDHPMPMSESVMESHSASHPPLAPQKLQTLRTLLQDYESLAQALAADDAIAASKAVSALTESLSALQKAESPDSLAREDMAGAKEIENIVTDLKIAPDIVALRNGFRDLSMALITWWRSAPISAIGPVYRAYCPMAFDSAGASWLTTDKQIRNPYFGAEMLQCGSIEEVVIHSTDETHE